MNSHDNEFRPTVLPTDNQEDNGNLTDRIRELKTERNAVILVHNYQLPEVQEIGDFLGDSLGLARRAAATDADVIVFCGVYFMAETACILSPDKTVILPDLQAGCPLADMVGPEDVIRLRGENPGAAVVCYVNSTAAVKAESDYCCTSSNAVEVVSAVPEDSVIFVPDRNLGRFVAERVEKRIITWNGYCPAHDNIKARHIEEMLKLHPGAEVIAHPECSPEVQSISNHICSTSKMVEVAQDSGAREFIAATESGMIYPLSLACPDTKFYPPAEEPVCRDMKLITLPKVLEALRTLEPAVTVPEEVRVRALGAVERMLSLG